MEWEEYKSNVYREKKSSEKNEWKKKQKNGEKRITSII